MRDLTCDTTGKQAAAHPARAFALRALFRRLFHEVRPNQMPAFYALVERIHRSGGPLLRKDSPEPIASANKLKKCQENVLNEAELFVWSAVAWFTTSSSFYRH
jgi:hypothetical protein